MLERVNIATSLSFVSPNIVVSAAAMLTLLAYTFYGNDLSPQQVSDFSGTPKCFLIKVHNSAAN